MTTVSRLYLRRPRLFWIGTGLLALSVVGSAIVPAGAVRPQVSALTEAPAAPIGVDVQVATTADGHHALTVADGPAGAEGLTFAQLGQWHYQPEHVPPCPPEVQAHHGRPVRLTGFMYPLAPGERVTVFCLRSTQTCCFGPRPQYNQYLFVETREPVPFERSRPVQVSGRFQVDPQPGQGYIYRIEDATVGVAAGGDDPVDPAAAAAALGLPRWDWAPLAGLAGKTGGGPVLPPALTASDRRELVIDGFVVDRDPGPPAQFVVGSHPPPGRPEGRAPTRFDAVTVVPASGVATPPAWQERAVWRGRLVLTTDPAAWNDRGIAQVVDARPCSAVPDGTAGRSGQRPPAWLPLALFLLLLLATVGRRPPPAHPEPTPGSP